MGYICDFCGAQRSMVYCRSDAACLCLSCDRIVHDANALSKRHSRTLICERCNSQPAFVRCVDEKVSLCQNCDWSGHGGSTSSSSSHKKQTINCYSGCPSSTELSTIWSFILDLPLPTENGSSCEGFGSLTIVENGVKNSLVDKDSDPDECAVVRATDAESADKSAIWMGSPSIPELLAPQHTHRPCELGDPTSPELDAILESVQKRNAPGAKADTIYEDDPYEDLDMDEVDLNFENYEELFGVTLTNSEKLLENGGIDSLFPKQVASTPDCSQGALGAEGSSIGPTNSMQAACSNAVSADSVVSIRTEPNIGFSAKQAQSGVSFSGLIGENTSGDYQDCAASSMFLHGEPPWCPPGSESSLQSASRSKAVMRYKEKKKTRQFEKKVRYAARKARADGRKRVKGRFIKAGDAYDYDPKTRSY